MDLPLLSQKNYNYLHLSLQRIQNIQTQDDILNYEDNQNRACSSLCELSNNICLEDAKNQSGIDFFKKTKQKQIRLSPWNNKCIQKESNKKQQKRFISKHSVNQFVQKSDFTRCRTENKQNFDDEKGASQNQNKLMKITSVILKKTWHRQKKLNYKPQHQQIEFIALMCKRKKYSVEIGQSTFLKQRYKINETQPIIHKSLTPKILNLHHIQQQNQKTSDKKFIKNGLSEEMKDYTKNMTLINEHWKTKSNQNKYKKKIFIVRDIKSSQARDVKQNLLLGRRRSLSIEKQKKEQYKSNNPLTRLLYEKYLHTIGMNSNSRQLRTKHL